LIREKREDKQNERRGTLVATTPSQIGDSDGFEEMEIISSSPWFIYLFWVCKEVGVGVLS